MGRTASPPLTEPLDILMAKGRSYFKQKFYVVLLVFSTHRSEVKSLEKAFGGSVKRHLNGFVWSMANEEHLRKLMETIPKEKWPSRHCFEDKIKK